VATETPASCATSRNVTGRGLPSVVVMVVLRPSLPATGRTGALRTTSCPKTSSRTP